MSNEPLMVGEGYTLAGTLRNRANEPVMAGDMTLRDHFAGQALNGLFSTDGHVDDVRPLVKYCYAVADAMLAERNKQ